MNPITYVCGETLEVEDLGGAIGVDGVEEARNVEEKEGARMCNAPSWALS
jgi:hypothetical protein